jgi:hypothetical protein
MMSDESMVGAGASAAAPEWQAAADEIIAEYAGEDRETKHEMIAWAKETLWADEAFCVNAVAYVAKGLGVGVKGPYVINVKPPAAAKPLPKPVASEGLSLPAPSVEAGDLAFDIRALRARMDRASPWDGSLAKAAEEAGEKRVIKPAEASPRLPAMIEHRPRAEPGLRGEIKLPIAAAAAEQVHLLNQKHPSHRQLWRQVHGALVGTLGDQPTGDDTDLPDIRRLSEPIQEPLRAEANRGRRGEERPRWQVLALGPGSGHL